MYSIKLTFNNEVRRVQFPKESNNCVSFEKLTQTVRNIFPALKNKALSLLWRDDENDLITVSSDQELTESVRVMELSDPSKLLRFIVRTDEGKDIVESHVTSAVVAPSVLGVCHIGVRCDECNMVPITGIRYKCAVREDFDLCETCEAKKTQPFPMIKIADPQHAPAAIVYAFKDQNGKEVSTSKPVPQDPQENGFWRPQNIAQRLGFGHPPGRGVARGWHPHDRNGGPPGPPGRGPPRPHQDYPHGHHAPPPPPGFMPHGPPHNPHGPPPPHHQVPPPHHQVPPQGHGGRGCGGRGFGARFVNKVEKWERKIEKFEHKLAKAKSAEPVTTAASFVQGMDEQTFSLPASVASYASINMPVSELQRVLDEESELQQAIRESCQDQQEHYGRNEEDEDVEDIDFDDQHSVSSAAVSCKSNTAPTESSQMLNSNAYSTLTNSLSSVSTPNQFAVFGMNSNVSLPNVGNGSLNISASALPPKYEMRFVRDVTFPNGTLVQPGAVFTKIWRVRNDGLYDWPENVTLAFAGGDVLSDTTVHEVVPELAVGAETDISMTLQAPETTGRFVTYFRMETADETKFGQRLYANIQVSDEESEWQLVRVAIPTDDEEKRAAAGGEGENITPTASECACPSTVVKVQGVKEECDGDKEEAKLIDEEVEEDEVNDSLEASMTLPRLPVDAETPSADYVPSVEEYSEFAAEITMIESAVEANNSHVEEEDAMQCSAVAEVESYQNTVAVLWEKELSLLSDMGFTDIDALVPLLQQHVITPASVNGGSSESQVEGMQRLVASLLGML